MKTIVLYIFFLLTFSTLSAQDKPDTIRVEKSFGTAFIWRGERLTPPQLQDIMKNDPTAYQEMKTARSNAAASSVFGFAGGFLIGWPLGTAIAGGEPNWSLAGVGAGLVVVAIPFSSAYTRHATKAVRIYNRTIRQTGYHRPLIRFGPSMNGIGLTCTF